MKKMNTFFVLVLLCPVLTFAQYCESPTELGSTVEVWDWTQEWFTVYVKNQTNGTTTELEIQSPFQDVSTFQPNVVHLILSEVDEYSPEVGWELVYKQFGVPMDGTTMPLFVLYNRFTGKMRLFYYSSVALANYDQINLSLRNFSTGSVDHVSAALEHVNTPMRVIENYTDAEFVIENPNIWQGNAGTWIFADVPIAYDPCTCQYSSALLARNVATNEQQLEITLEGSGSIEQVMENGQAVPNADKAFNINNLGEGISKGSKAYKKFDGVVKDIDKSFANKINNNLTPEMISFLQSNGLGSDVSSSEIGEVLSLASSGENEAFGGLISGLSGNSLGAIVPDFLKSSIPYVGAAVELFSFFSGGEEVTPLNFSVDLDFVGEGTISDFSNLESNIFLTPGAKSDGINSPDLIPVYNNVLGVANLTERPVLHKAEKIEDELVSLGNGNYEGTYTVHTSYKLGEEIKYAFNRATGLGIEKVAGAIYFNNCSTADAPEGVQNLIQVEQNVWRTPYMSLACLERYSVFMEYEEIEEPPYYSGATGTHCADNNITFHFLLNTGENLFAATYRVDVENAPYSFDDTPENPFVDIDESLTTTDLDGVLSGTIQAWGDITVTGEITVTEENIDLLNDLSPSEVVITVVESDDPNVASYIEYKEVAKEYSVGAVISDGLIVQNAPDCGFVLPVGESYLEELCNNESRYNPIALRTIGTDVEESKNWLRPEITINPNPTHDLSAISFDSAIENKVTVEIFDMMGRKLKEPISEEVFPAGKNIVNIDLTDLANATYLIRVTHESGAETFKLSKH